MTLPSVAVIIPAYRSEKTIDRCLRHLENQASRDFEVIVVDSSPDDATAGVVRRYPGVRLVRSARRLLPQAARNRGVAESAAPLIASIDPDIYAAPRWLEALVARHAATGGIVVGSYALHGSGLLQFGYHLCKFSKWLPARKARRIDIVPSGNMLVSRDDFLRLGGYDGERFVDDIDFSRRAREARLPIWFEPEAAAAHDHRATFGEFLTERYERGLWYGELRGEWLANSPASRASLLLATVLPLRLASNVARVAGQSLRAGEFARFLATFPIVLAGYCASLAGEAKGLLSKRRG